MKKRNQFEKQIKNVEEETDSPAVLNDVVDSEFKQYPGQNENQKEDSLISPLEEAVQHNIDGKTWITTDDE
ncbi:hypothetical protein [Virgibacillus litoralis]|uniref:DUF4025 domain-containing protein n=1 Tax=Virgibacillus litoralis TaxID=578221 RepID=A0ABS4HII6_9BACI|nr:hypothetical protein [Virgibacillus litoralis]MBP1950736.1 hypothetical protein [Virgibacillus litoralis]